MKKTVVKVIGSVKTLLAPIVAYYKTLPTWGKVILILVCIIAKLGPDFILFPIIYKVIKRKQEKKAASVAKEKNDQTEA